MDVQMPVMDGVEATRQIRQSNTSYKNIPIIAMTAYALTGDKENFLTAGMNAYVSKPIRSRVFFKDVSKVISNGLSN